jgi:xeroderma pigmentosum group C-complementing protein
MFQDDAHEDLNGSGEEGAMGGLEDPMQATALFGEWQTAPYVPLPVVDGKVPKNEFGTVDLFKPSMLPGGGVHVPLQGVAGTAKRLGIDFGLAVVGFDFQSGGAHPRMDGVVVAAESEDLLRDAWETEQQVAREKKGRKREAAVYKRWQSLLTKLMIRERVRSEAV